MAHRLGAVGRPGWFALLRRWKHQNRSEILGHQELAAAGDEHRLELGVGLHERHPLLRAHDRHGGRVGVRVGGIGGHERDALGAGGLVEGPAGARVEDVRVTLAVDLEEALIAAGGDDGAVGGGDGRERAGAVRALDADLPRGAALAARYVGVATTCLL